MTERTHYVVENTASEVGSFPQTDPTQVRRRRARTPRYQPENWDLPYRSRVPPSLAHPHLRSTECEG